MPVVSQSQKREEVADDGVQLQRPVGLVPVQEDGDRGNGDVGEYQRYANVLPSR